jgi:hypothetical protein
MPQKYFWDVNPFPVDIGTVFGGFTFPYGLSFLLPIFVLTLVKEKEDRIQIMYVHHLHFN